MQSIARTFLLDGPDYIDALAHCRLLIVDHLLDEVLQDWQDKGDAGPAGNEHIVLVDGEIALKTAERSIKENRNSLARVGAREVGAQLLCETARLSNEEHHLLSRVFLRVDLRDVGQREGVTVRSRDISTAS